MKGPILPGGAERLGLSGTALQAAWALLDHAVAQQNIPGGVALVARNGHFATHAAGHAVLGNGVAILASADTVYDCASLTKVVVTLPLILLLSDQGKLRLDDLAAAYVPEFGQSGKHAVTIRQLLSHTSGLAAHWDLYSHGWTPDEMFACICRMKPAHVPGTRCVYSCLGYIVLGRIAERLLGEPLAQAAERLLFRPLGMSASRFNPPCEWRPRIAATEYDPALGGFRWGRVHDENAYAFGGVSGNAGLFTTVDDLARYAQMWLVSANAGVAIEDSVAATTNAHTGQANALLSPSAVRQALSSHTPRIPGAHRGLGWVLKDDPADVTGNGLSRSSYGHTGFTGTSLWIDPERDLVVVLLTNRVHFGRDTSIAKLRHDIHQAVAAAIRD
ncbi:beta-lactamase family protein [Paenibacillus sp. MER TA 81-3]|uniref:serine hydrolase domain-containing protein n=1 Tax=Paenibacillus sp. MER TA 81-3 TaxID=2939573 RepID=UPI00203E5B32|nr:serine hydrolase domain-containing protein [Paenibacillus sp. MER TA 81-3]MCM3341434.1 beta-lactamase family protein [Paenibacillus sp. MER TA 81-3]